MNLRDVSGWEAMSLPVSTESNAAAKYLDQSIQELYGWCGDPVASARAAIKEDEEFLLAHVVVCGLELLSTGTKKGLSAVVDGTLDRLNEVSKKRNILQREKDHLAAINAFSDGHFHQATNYWEKILVDHPTDPIALRFASDMYFYLGESAKIRDSVARVKPYWKKDDPLYGYTLGMYAFGLEETLNYRAAEMNAIEALQINRTDCWATHARAHVFEMEGRAQEGIDFLMSTETDWNQGLGLACHNYWHAGLAHIEQGDFESALGIYDKEIAERKKSGAILDLVDAASFLFRLNLAGVEVGDRWQDVYKEWVVHNKDHVTVFNDAHYTMSLMNTHNDEQVAKEWLQSLDDYMKEGDQTNQIITQNIGKKVCSAITNFKLGNYSSVVSDLINDRYNIVKIGGSHAQRDVFSQVLISSAIKAGKSNDSESEHYNKIALSLLNERRALKPKSGLTDRYFNQLQNL